jgi:hypothetical protein
MTIQLETTHNLGDFVYFIHNDKITAGTIYRIDATLDEDGQSAFLFVKTKDHNSVVIRPHKVFNSRQQLIDQL